MFNRGSFVLRLIGALLLVGLMIGGGVMAYRVGYGDGLADAPEIATVVAKAAEDGQPLPIPPMIRYGRSYANPLMWMHPRYGFMPFGGVVGFVFLVILFFGLMRLLFLRRLAWYHGFMHGHAPWKGYGPWGPPPWAHEGKEDDAKSDAEAEKEDK